MESGALTMRIVCTDRGQHRRVVICLRVSFDDEGHLHMARPFEAWAPPDTPRNDGTVTTTYEFQCPRCGRSPQVRPDKWRQIAERLLEARLEELDISNFPF